MAKIALMRRTWWVRSDQSQKSFQLFGTNSLNITDTCEYFRIACKEKVKQMLLKFKDQQEYLGYVLFFLYVSVHSRHWLLWSTIYHHKSVGRLLAVLCCCGHLHFFSCSVPAQHGQEEQEQKIKKYIDKLKRKFSLCIDSIIFEIICNLGEKEKISRLKNKSLPWFHVNTVLWFLVFYKFLNPKFSHAS